MSESETKTATGTCAEISERGEWTTFHVDVGSQYPVKVSTKHQPIIELGRAAQKAGGRFVWTYSESDGNPNPNRPGTFYKNRYLNSVEAEDVHAVTSSGLIGPPVEPTYAAVKPDVDWDAKERRDYRSRAWAQTLGAFTHTISVEDRKDSEKMKEIFANLQVFQRLVFQDVCQSFAYPDVDEDENIPF